jgi:hypothetical protein
MASYRPTKQKFMKGYHPIVRPRGNVQLGKRNAVDMAIVPTMIEAIASCMNLSSLYYDRGFGISDCTVEPFEGMVSDL